MRPRLNVVISSSARDLPEHRRHVIAACERMGMFPLAMENLPADPADAVTASLRLVGEAHVYVGVFAERYGTVAPGREASITELEYDRARERGLPCLIFFAQDDPSVRRGWEEPAGAREKLQRLKDRLSETHVVGFFCNPDDLRAQVIHALAVWPPPEDDSARVIRAVPAPPEADVVHPYTLLATRFVGRRAELDLFSDWAADPKSADHAARLMCVVAIGGMGKSAVTWTWFNDVAPGRVRPLAGRLWWSFYETDATFDKFVDRLLAYVGRLSPEEVGKLSAPERMQRALAALDREPHLLVLDGLERLLIAYARPDAAHLADDDLDEKTANRVTGVLGLPAAAAQSFVGQHRLRKAADPRVGLFLQKLSQVRASRTVVTTRLFPAELQTPTGGVRPGTCAVFLRGLDEGDAVELWRAMGVRGSRQPLVPLFDRFERHPLLIQALAGEVASYRAAPGDFDRWVADHPGFDPFALPLVQVKSHVLQFALGGLTEAEAATLATVAAFRMPTTFDTLVALLIDTSQLHTPLGPLVPPPRELPRWPKFEDDGPAWVPPEPPDAAPTPRRRGIGHPPFSAPGELDAVLSRLEDRGLLGWDRAANQYDLHPVVRGVVWAAVEGGNRAELYSLLERHFQAAPSPEFDFGEVPTPERLQEMREQLVPVVELYHVLFAQAKFDAAGRLLRDAFPSMMNLFGGRFTGELVHMLLPGDTLDAALVSDTLKEWAVHSRGLCLDLAGEPGLACRLYRIAGDLCAGASRDQDLNSLDSEAMGRSVCGNLRRAERLAREGVLLSRREGDLAAEANFLATWAEVLMVRGRYDLARPLAKRSAWLSQRDFNGFASAQAILFDAEATSAEGTTEEASAAVVRAAQRWADLCSAGGVALRVATQYAARHNRLVVETKLRDPSVGYEVDERVLEQLVMTFRATGRVEQELGTLVALATLRHGTGNHQGAREILDDVWELADRGPYPVHHADAFNVLARVERDCGNAPAAKAAAAEAYRRAWCDGPPYAYAAGLREAQQLLDALGATVPVLPAFDEAAADPLPEVQILGAQDSADLFRRVKAVNAKFPKEFRGTKNQIAAYNAMQATIRDWNQYLEKDEEPPASLRERLEVESQEVVWLWAEDFAVWKER